MPPKTTRTPARPANPLHALGIAAAAAAVLVASDLVVRTVPFAAIARRIETTLRRTPAANAHDGVRRVQWAVDAARRRLPWTIACLATAIAANRLLAWRGIASELWLGVRASEKQPIDAHAWLIAEGRVVTGAAEKETYRPLRALVTAAR